MRRWINRENPFFSLPSEIMHFHTHRMGDRWTSRSSSHGLSLSSSRSYRQHIDSCVISRHGAMKRLQELHSYTGTERFIVILDLGLEYWPSPTQMKRLSLKLICTGQPNMSTSDEVIIFCLTTGHKRFMHRRKLHFNCHSRCSFVRM